MSTNYWEERIKALMDNTPHPNSLSVYMAMKQLQNEIWHAVDKIPPCGWVHRGHEVSCAVFDPSPGFCNCNGTLTPTVEKERVLEVISNG